MNNRDVDLPDLLGVDLPLVQAGMGGGLATGQLAGAVSKAGALGTIGLLPASVMSAELHAARELAGGRPVAANLLMPFARREHVDACVAAGARAVALFFGYDREVVERLHDAKITVLHQVGTVGEARRALAAGADVLVAQAREAGGHLLGVQDLESAIRDITAVAGSTPVLAAGGIVIAEDARRALAAGAAGVAVGTRFLLTDESNAHDEYKARVLSAEETIETTLFGLAWPARHRVVSNQATERWCHPSGRAKALPSSLNRVMQPLTKLMPDSAAELVVRRQRVSRPFFSPAPLLRGMDSKGADVTPLYAGGGVNRIHELRSAAAVVEELAAGLR